MKQWTLFRGELSNVEQVYYDQKEMTKYTKEFKEEVRRVVGWSLSYRIN